MPIKPKSFMAKCPKCGKIKLIAPKSDALRLLEVAPICEKCKKLMVRWNPKGLGDFFKGIFGLDSGDSADSSDSKDFCKN